MELDPFSRCYRRQELLPGRRAYRLQLAERYAYVLPEPPLLEVIQRHSPIVEIGAGTGYWAYMLRLAGADVVAYDQAPMESDRANRYHPGGWGWSEVITGDARMLDQHQDRALFVCWPPASYRSGMSSRSTPARR